MIDIADILFAGCIAMRRLLLMPGKRDCGGEPARHLKDLITGEGLNRSCGTVSALQESGVGAN